MLYQFDQFQLDPVSTKLYKESKLISDDGKIIKALHILCANYPEVVDKELLINEIWPKQIVTDASLSKLISDTRQLLGDNGKDQGNIKTVRGRGFRLNTHVEIQQTETVNRAPVSSSGKVKKNLSLPLLALSIVLLGAAVIYFSGIVKPKQVDKTAPLKLAVLPVVSETEDHLNDWVTYGLMSMVAEQLSQYSSLQVIPVAKVIQSFPAEWNKPGVKIENSQLFEKICGQLGCSQLLEMRFKSVNGQPFISYQIIENGSNTVFFEFNSIDIIDATDKLLEHLAIELIPAEKDIIPLETTFSQNNKANRDYAIGVHELLSGEVDAARNYLLLALQRQPDFFWAKAYLAEVHYRAGNLKQASSAIDELDNARLSPDKSYFLQHLQSNILYSQGDIKQSLSTSRKLKKNAYVKQNPLLLGNELLNIGSSLQALGKNAEAITPLLEARKSYQKAGYGSGEGKVLFNLANIYLASQEFEKAVKYYQQAKEVFLRFGLTGYLLMAKHQLVTSRLSLGEIQNADTELRSLIDSYKKIGDLEGEITAKIDLANVSLKKLDYNAAIERLERLLPELDQLQFTYQKNLAILILVKANLMIDNIERAEQLFLQLEGDWRDNRAAFALLPAHIEYSKGNLHVALDRAAQIKAKLGDSWIPAHEDIVEQMKQSLASGEVHKLNY